MSQRFSFESATGLGEIVVHHWPVKAPRGLVQIVHGMQEHMQRYDAFAHFLNAHGYAVAGDDHAGHGLSTPQAPRGYFGKRDGARHLLDDLHTVQVQMQSQYPGMPYILFGHSMGSFLARAYTARHAASLEAVIYSGSSSGNAAAPLGKLLTHLHRGDTPFWLLDRIAFAPFNRRYAPVTGSEWLNRDASEVHQFLNDPLRVPCFTARGFYDLFTLLQEVSRRRWARAIPPALPVLLLGGDGDPLGAYGKGILRIAHRLRTAGHPDVTAVVYPGARHELLLETNRAQVMDDILAFLHAHGL